MPKKKISLICLMFLLIYYTWYTQKKKKKTYCLHYFLSQLDSKCFIRIWTVNLFSPKLSHFAILMAMPTNKV